MEALPHNMIHNGYGPHGHITLCHIHVAPCNMICLVVGTCTVDTSVSILGYYVIILGNWLSLGTIRNGTERYGAVRYGTVRYGTVRYGTVRYGTVLFGVITLITPSKFGNVRTKFGNGHEVFKLYNPSGQPYTWGHLGGACRVPLAHKVWHSS